MKQKVIIMGAAGRDFHNFNTYFRNNSNYEVAAFTATQIPNIDGRRYPASLAGELYPQGIPIYDEKDLVSLIKEYEVNQVVFAYSDVSHNTVMAKASTVLAAGADFRLMGPDTTMLKSSVPIVAVCAVRTGVGKSQTTRRVAKVLKELGKKVVVVRHPMPYGDLEKQACQRFASYEDLDKHNCTIEEREEYEPHLAQGFVVYAGVDYQQILDQAQKEADVVLWDGGNNDLPFFKPDVHITLVDPHRPGDELNYHPGEANLRMADIVIINKIETSSLENVEKVRSNIRSTNPNAVIVDAASPIFVENYGILSGKKVLVVEDGPTLTHGDMTYGAGAIAARKYGAAELVDPRPYAQGSIRETFNAYSHLSNILPAMGYGKEQREELEETIAKAEADVVVIGTPIDLRRLINIEKPAIRVRYELQEIGEPNLEGLLRQKLNL
ncbi:cyclic 2,3-diphosphoglycerate synthase [Desulfitibacter alkalitolerans]|uniref:cyclic 2,3-diphosphoglycerate synthase n=1 Tax=Desulfitibacter alkalitolerans TaxID=264641 RepID=UPI0005571919|nr:cyclic 2,3-diphosphoglycerate synthase [Desulfitibacter alkalitolerans]